MEKKEDKFKEEKELKDSEKDKYKNRKSPKKYQPKK